MHEGKMNSILENWMFTTVRFDFINTYLPGSVNNFADAFSRMYEGYDVYVGARGGELKSVPDYIVHADESNVALQFEANKRGKRLPLLSDRPGLIEKYHALGHLGTMNVFRKIWHAGYWWPNMKEDIRRYCHKCIQCLKFDVKQQGFHPAKSVTADKPWDHVQIDLIGAIPASEEGYQYILMCVDVMSGYVVLRPLLDKSAASVAKALWNIIAEYGTMKIIQSDNGTEFVNSIIEQMVQMYGIDHRLITAYHPVANGMVERQNKEVARALKKYTYSSFGQWHMWLPLIQLGLNSRHLERTKSTPFALMFGREFNDFDDSVI